jgi:ribosomal protein L7/L12
MPDGEEKSRRWFWLRPVRVSRAAQQDADHQAGEQLVGLLDERTRAEVEGLLVSGEYIFAVRRVREQTGLRLIDAKRLVDSLPR